MAQTRNPKLPRYIPGTNLTWDEALRLVLLLCLAPWMFAAALFIFKIVPLPKDAVGWIITALSGPAAWGAFISAVVDGRTLLGRSREPGTLRQRWWQAIRSEDQPVHRIIDGKQIAALGDIAENHSTIAKNESVGISGDNNIVVTGEVKGDFLGPGATKIMKASGPETDGAALREAYLTRVLEQTRTLQLSGVDPEAAQEQTASTGLALAAVYTALMTQQTEQPDGQGGRGAPMPERETTRLSAVALLDRSPKLALLGDPGSGKSTFVNFVALCLAGEMLQRADANLQLLTMPLPPERPDHDKQPQSQPWRHGALLPVRIVLRDFAAHGLPAVGQPANGDHLWRFIVAELGENQQEYAPHLSKELKERGGLILLDGLDEVPQADTRREQVKQAVTGFAADFPRCRFLATSRTYAYQRQDWKLPGFAEGVLAPFGWGQIERFVTNWYAHVAVLRGQNPTDAQGRATLLKEAIRRSDRLMVLAERPLLLTLMASLHAWRGGELPEKREALYDNAVDLLLNLWEKPKVVRGADSKPVVLQPGLAEWLRVDKTAVRDLLNELAFEVHRDQPDLVSTADIAEDRLVSRLVKLSNNPDVKPGRVIEYVCDRAGLLAARGQGVYTFPHRTFQEYLAACHLTDDDYPDKLAKLTLADSDRWREVALLAGAKAARGSATSVWNLAKALCCHDVTTQPAPSRYLAALLAAQTLIENGALARISERNQPKAARVQQWLRAIVERGALGPVDRAAAGDALAVFGDDRPGVGVRDGVLDIVWCDVPAGEFIMGSRDDRLAWGKETPQHTLALPDFRIGKYPVTNAQFDAFVQDGGYTARRRDCWTQAGWKWKGKRSGPDKFGGVYDLPNHPAVMITWYEAAAFCNWLGEKLGFAVTLPSEAQWEKAARGPATRSGDGRTYPWGEKITPDHANYVETGIGTTSAVGIFPKGASPCDALDMSGNVWEWTRSLWGDDWQKSSYNYPYTVTDGREDPDASSNVLRVLRGGAFYCFARLVRCACRGRFDPLNRGRNLGFRVVASPNHS